MGNLRIEGQAKFAEISSFKGRIEVNQHGVFQVRGTAEAQTGYAMENYVGTALHAFWNQDGQETLLFSGYITQCRVQREGGITYLEATVHSATIQFDQRKRTRLYQQISMTYGQIFQELSGDGRKVAGLTGQNQQPDYPLLQYQETDWQFLKRIAHMLHTVIIPETSRTFPQLSVGMVEGHETAMEPTNHYDISVDYQQYRERKKENLPLREFLEYRLETGKNLQPGDRVFLEGRRLSVVKKEFQLKKGEVVYTYWLSGEKKWQSTACGSHLAGLSLTGKVLKAEGEKIKLHLDADEGEAPSPAEAYPFDYVPITGNIMYAMPEPGAAVSLYFPGDGEKGIVTNCIYSSLVEEDHNQKTMELPSGEMMRLSPGEMTLSTEKNAWLQVKDSRGIRMGSKAGIRLEGKEKIRLCGGNVTMASQSGICMVNRKQDSMEIEGRQLTFHSPQYTLSAVRHQTVKEERSMKSYLVISNLEAVAYSVMGGVASGELDEIGSSIAAGIPAVLNTEKSFMDGMASISWNRR